MFVQKNSRHNSCIFLSYQFDVCLLQCLFFVLNFFFQLSDDYFSRQTVLTQRAQQSLHSPRSYHFFIFYSYQFDVCLFSKKCMSIIRFFFQLSSTDMCFNSVGATFPVVYQQNVFIAVPNHFVFGRAKFSYSKFQLEGGQCDYLPRTSCK